MEEAKLQWTLEQHTKAKEKEKGRTKEKDMAKEATKEKDTNKEKATAATADTTKERPKESNNNGISQKEERKATKESRKEFPTKEKKRTQQQYAIDVSTRPLGKGMPNSGVSGFASTTYKQSNTNSSTVGNAEPSGSVCSQ